VRRCAVSQDGRSNLNRRYATGEGVLTSVVELVKFVGGLSGLASAAFLIYDRMFRFRPLAFLIPVEHKTNIRFSNVAPETVIIDQITITPPIVKVVKANDLMTENDDRAAVWYPTKDEKPEFTFVVIKPMDKRTFALHRSAEFESWRNTRKSLPFPRF
jgi:hypothetical protein